jgi:hypothetical protein
MPTALGAASAGLRFPTGLVQFDFRPSVGIMVRDMEHFAIDIRSYRVPLERAVRQIMMPSITENFNTSGRPVPWAPLSDATWEKRAQDGWSGGDILIKSGTLRSVAGSFKIWKIGTGGAAVTGLPPGRLRYTA